MKYVNMSLRDMTPLQQRAESTLRTLDQDLQQMRTAYWSAKEALVRVEAQREAELNAATEKLNLLEQAKTHLHDSFKALSAEALSSNNESFLNLAKTTLKTYQQAALFTKNYRSLCP